MKRAVLDTNIYGEIAIDPSLQRIRNSLAADKRFIFYGIDIIRKELRDTSKTERIRGKSLRMLLLTLYDEITKEHSLKINAEAAEFANNFHHAYKKQELPKLIHYDEFRRWFS